VNLVLEHDSLFTADQRAAKASVVLHLRQRGLSDDQVRGIQNLVASAVDGLQPQNVVVVDAEGEELLGHETADGRANRQERELAARLVRTIEPVAGAGNVRASVSLVYSPVTADEVDETYDPAQTATLSMQSTDQTSGQPAASGVPGTASNAPNTKPPLYPQQTPTNRTMKQQSATYGVSKKVRHTQEAAGAVQRLTAAVLINYQRVGQGKQAKWTPRSAAEMQQLTALAEAAIGFSASRGDQISVEQIAFDENAPPAPAPVAERVRSALRQYQGLLRYGVILLALLGFFLFIARPVVKALTGTGAARKALPAAGARPLAAPETPELAAHAAADPKRIHAQNVFEQVSEQVKRDPAQSTRLLESWIRSE
jgi:flagellar M-ring protein FliF